MATQKPFTAVLLRRLSQTVFLLLFLYLFLATIYRPEDQAGGLLTLFFDLDPLVMITVWIGGRLSASIAGTADPAVPKMPYPFNSTYREVTDHE